MSANEHVYKDCCSFGEEEVQSVIVLIHNRTNHTNLEIRRRRSKFVE
jgi:hypothetical protein